MDTVLYNAVTKDNIDVLKEMDRGLISIDKQRTATGSTVLHLACQHGSIKCLEHILSVHKSLLLMINSTGETALHLAARGDLVVVAALLDTAKSSNLKSESSRNTSLTAIQFLIQTTDVEGETALHVAVRYNQKNVIQRLLSEDRSHTYLGNKYDETPLYLASSGGRADIIKTILENSGSPTFGGPKGRTALHAALLHIKGHECAKVLLEKKRELIEKADNYGWTAFHYAAHNDVHTIVEDLVAAGKSVGYLADMHQRKTALHVAAYQGNDCVMKKLVEHYPDSLQTVDWQEKNILHIAIEQDEKKVINFIVSNDYKEIHKLLLARDEKGNTPLHLIAMYGCYVMKLMRLTTAPDWRVLNHEGLTPWDVLRHVPNESLKIGHSLIKASLYQAKLQGQYFPLQDVEKMEHPEKRKNPRQRMMDLARLFVEKNEKAIATHIIVATLVTTVALTAGFAVPGGFKSDGEEGGSTMLSNKGAKGEEGGSAMLLHKAAFQTFMITDAVALVLSASSLFLYFMTILFNMFKDEGIVGTSCFIASCFLNVFSIMAMMLAFISGTFGVLAKSLPLAITVCLISSSFFLIALYVCVSICTHLVADHRMVVHSIFP